MNAAMTLYLMRAGAGEFDPPKLRRMILLARPSSATRARAGNPRLGLLATPRGLLRDIPPQTIWAADNDCFQGLNEPRFRRMVAWCREQTVPPAFVTVPDVVGDAARTLELFAAWEPELRGLPLAFVTQDGLDPAAVPWDRIRAVFLGGSDAHKFGPVARAVAEEARARGVWVHAGRVQTLKKIRAMVGIADSIDGTCTARLPNFWVPKLLGWIGRAYADHEHTRLFRVLGEGG